MAFQKGRLLGRWGQLRLESLEDRRMLSVVPVATADNYQAFDNHPLQVDPPHGVLVNDTGDNLTAVLVNGPTSGQLQLNPDGSFSYNANQGFVGTDSFTYNAVDGTQPTAPVASVPATVTIQVYPDPVGKIFAVNDYYGVVEDNTLTTNAARGVLTNDLAPPNLKLSATLVAAPTNGQVQLNADGSFAYTPQPTFVGIDTFTYNVTGTVPPATPGGPAPNTSDVALLSNTATVSIDVLSPAAKDDFYATPPNQTLTIGAAQGVLANDRLGTLTATASLVSSPINGSVTLNADGSFSYTPNTGFQGADTFTYQDSTSLGDTNTASVTIKVAGPRANNDYYQTTEGQALTVNAADGVLANDQLGDGGGTATLVASPQNGTVQLNADGSFTYTPTAGYVGPDLFTYQATTAKGDTNVATVNIAVRPLVPVHAADDGYQVAENTTLSVDAAHGVLANDLSQATATLSATLVTGPANGTLQLNADGSFTYTPGTGFTGADIFTYTASDGTNTSNTATVTIEVHPPLTPPPVVAVNDYYVINTGGTLAIEATHGVLANDHFNHDSPPKVTLAGGTANGSLTLNADGSFTYTPNASFTGLDTFTYTDDSGTAVSNTATVVILVQPNTALHAANDIYTIPQNGVLTVGPDHGVLANDPVVPGTTLTAVLVTGPVNGNLTLNADGSFTYTPNTGFTGADTFSYEDNNGTTNSNVAVVTIYVISPKIQSPVAVDDFYSGTPGTPLVVSAADGVLDNDLSKNGAALTATLVNQPADGTVTLNSDGSFTYTPSPTFQGNDVFTYQDSDGTNTSNVAAVHIRIHGVATNPPLAVPDVYEVLQSTTLTVGADHGVLQNDYSGNDAPLTATLVSNPANGTLAFQGDGSFTYTPTAGFTGNDSFTYTANNGVADSNVATVTIHVHPPIVIPPVAVNDTYATAPGQALTTDAAHGVLNNDIAANGATLTAALVAGPANGTLTLNSDGSFTYTPNTGYTGVDVFTYKANDGTSDSNVAAVYIRVTTNASGPIAFDDTYTVTANAPLTVTAANGVLSNDHGNSLTATLLNTTIHGTLVFNSDGSFTYTPDSTFQGTDVFSYTASDGTSTSKPALVLLTLHAWHNGAAPDDVNGDGAVTPLDALNVINDLNTNGIRALPPIQADSPDALLDVNGDNMVSPVDALIVINTLNAAAGQQSTSSTKVEKVADVSPAAAVSAGTGQVAVSSGLQTSPSVDSASVSSSSTSGSVQPSTVAQSATTQAFANLDAQTASLDSVLNDLALDVYLAQTKKAS